MHDPERARTRASAAERLQMRDQREDIIGVTLALDVAGMVPDKSGNVSCRVAEGLLDHAGRRSIPWTAGGRRRDSAARWSAAGAEAQPFVGVAHARRHLPRPARRCGHRAHAQPARHGARVCGPRYSCLPLHDRAGRRRRALHVVLHVRHAAAGRSRPCADSRGAGPACSAITASWRWGRHWRARWQSRSKWRTWPERPCRCLPLAWSRQLLDEAEIQNVVARFTDYGRLG